MASVITTELRDIEAAILETNNLLGGSSGGATADKQDIANASLASIDSKTPNLMLGAVPVHVVNQIDISTISGYLLDIKNSCAAIDANTDTVEQKITDVITAINNNGTVNHNDLLAVIAELQSVDANTDGQEALLTSILNKLIASPATLAEQQSQTTALQSIDTKLPNKVLNQVPVLNTEYLTEVARGLIAGESRLELRGYNDSVGSGNYEPVWAQSGASYPLVTAAQTLTISSSDIDDNSTGTGARTALVTYIEFSTGNEVTVNAVLNGRNPVTITTDGYAVNAVRVSSVGSSNGNEGTLYVGYGTVTTGVPANILCSVDPFSNVSQQLIYTVPANKEANIFSYGVSVSKLMYVQLRIKPSKNSGLVYTEYDIPVNGTSPTPLLSVPIVLTAGQQIQCWSWASSTTGLLGMTMRGILRSV